MVEGDRQSNISKLNIKAYLRADAHEHRPCHIRWNYIERLDDTPTDCM